MRSILSNLVMVIFSIFLLLCGGIFAGAQQKAQEIQLIVRGDDMGMTQGSLAAFEKAFNEGVLTSGAIQACAPWFEGAAAMCKKNPGWCVGVHLCLVGEWQGYRWRPVLPWDQVKSIVDEDGYLYTDPTALFAHKPKIEDIEAEYRAQIALVKKRGVKIGYIDTHYLGYKDYPGIEEVFQKLARENDVPISEHMDESRMP
jgi:chitin disaccharide deacetylase